MRTERGREKKLDGFGPYAELRTGSQRRHGIIGIDAVRHHCLPYRIRGAAVPTIAGFGIDPVVPPTCDGSSISPSHDEIRRRYPAVRIRTCLRVAGLARNGRSADRVGALGAGLGNSRLRGKAVGIRKDGSVVPETLHRSGLGPVAVSRTRSRARLRAASARNRTASPGAIRPRSRFAGTRAPRTGRPRVRHAGRTVPRVTGGTREPARQSAVRPRIRRRPSGSVPSLGIGRSSGGGSVRRNGPAAGCGLGVRGTKGRGPTRIPCVVRLTGSRAVGSRERNRAVITGRGEIRGQSAVRGRSSESGSSRAVRGTAVDERPGGRKRVRQTRMRGGNGQLAIGAAHRSVPRIPRRTSERALRGSRGIVPSTGYRLRCRRRSRVRGHRGAANVGNAGKA